jgi:hypothetical protein
MVKIRGGRDGIAWRKAQASSSCDTAARLAAFRSLRTTCSKASKIAEFGTALFIEPVLVSFLAGLLAKAQREMPMDYHPQPAAAVCA